MTRELNIRIDCAGGSDLTSMLEATREQLLQRTDRNHTESRFDVADYKVVELHSRIEALQLTKHCGWCTGNTRVFRLLILF